MTQIINFTKPVRVGSNWPSCFDISFIASHEAYGGLIAQTFINGTKTFVQLRKSQDYVALIHFDNEEQLEKLPEIWVKAVILWDSRQK
jgi:hypothetical protein